MKIIYISSPYTLGDVAANVCVQIEAAHRIMDMGHCPVAPLLSHYLHIHRQREYNDWMAIDLAIIPKMDIVLRLPGKSSGAEKEVALAISLGIPVVYSWEELTALLAKTQDERTCFFRVNRGTNTNGIEQTSLSQLLTPGRRVRWQSTAAEYGLFEGGVANKNIGLDITISTHGKENPIYIEQVHEIALTHAEATALELGWPL